MPTDQGLPARAAAHRIQVAGADLQFREVGIPDPIVTGRQIIAAAGGRPAEEFIVLEWMVDGELCELNLDDTTDLRRPGAEKFIVERSATTYRFEIDSKRHEWPAPTITREALLAIARQDPAQFSVWQELRQQADREVVSGEPAQLEEKGLERFYTVMTHTTEG